MFYVTLVVMIVFVFVVVYFLKKQIYFIIETKVSEALAHYRKTYLYKRYLSYLYTNDQKVSDCITMMDHVLRICNECHAIACLGAVVDIPL